MFIASSKSKNKIVHYKKSAYVNMIKPENKIVFNKLTEAYDAGYAISKQYDILAQELSQKEKWLKIKSEQNNFTYNCNNHTLYIESEYNKWMIMQVSHKTLSLYIYDEKIKNDNTINNCYQPLNISNKLLELLVGYIIKFEKCPKYIASKKAKNKTVHNIKSGYAARIKQENRIIFNNLSEAYRAGYRVCKNKDLILRELKKQETWLNKKATEVEFLYYHDNDGLHITTPYGKWLIIQSGDNTLALYHRNTKADNNANYVVKLYHYQGVTYNNLQSAIEYILNHDNYIKENPRGIKKSKALKSPAPIIKGTKRHRQKKRYEQAVQRKNNYKHLMYLFEKISQPA